MRGAKKTFQGRKEEIIEEDTFFKEREGRIYVKYTSKRNTWGKTSQDQIAGLNHNTNPLV